MKLNHCTVFFLSCIFITFNVLGSHHKSKVLFTDDFTQESLAKRKAERGPWKFEKGVASCVQDDKIYKANKNHGPIIRYQVPITDATIEFDMMSIDARMFYFTINGKKGHIYRFFLKKKGTSVLAYGDKKSQKEIAKSDCRLEHNKWVPVKVVIRGDKAVATIGETVIEAQHPSYKSEKKIIMLAFAFGEYKFRNFKVTSL